MKSAKVEFRPPQGVVPEGTQSNEEFDLVCTFRVKENGTVCLITMGNERMPGYDKSEGRPGYNQYASEMMSQGDQMTLEQDKYK